MMAHGGYAGKGLGATPNNDPKYEDTIPVQGEPQSPRYEDTLPVGTDADTPKYEDTVPIAAAAPKYDDTIPVESDGSHSGLGQQAIAGLEGAAEGLAGPLAPYLEHKVLGVEYKDIAARAKENPWTHGIAKAGTFGASLLYGVGEAAAIAKTAEVAAQGSKVLNAAIQMGMYGASDEVTKSLLHQPSDPEQSVGTALLHIGGSALLGGATTPLFSILGKGLDAAVSKKMEEYSTKYLLNLAQNDPATKLAALGASAIAGKEMGKTLREEVFYGGSLYEMFEPWFSKITGKHLTKANRYIADAILGALGKPVGVAPELWQGMASQIPGSATTQSFVNNSALVPTAFRWGRILSEGTKSYFPAVEALFKGATPHVVTPISDMLIDELKGKVEEGVPLQQIDNAIPESQNFAKGGHVTKLEQNDHFGTLYPAQNLLLNSAKLRVYGYLNSIRPMENTSRLPYDNKTPNKDRENQYRRTLRIAAHPLQILNHIQLGDLTPTDVKDFTGMYPEAYKVLSKKIMEHVVNGEKDETKPSYQKRQSLSLFLGTPLDSTLTPASLQAAQMVFMQKRLQQQPAQGAQQSPPKRSNKASGLTKSSQDFLTGEQAREKRQQAIRS